MPSCARQVAIRVIHRVVSQQAYAGPSLDAELVRARLDARDARLATQIVYGTLRLLPDIDALLQPLLRRGWPEDFTSSALRAAAYQIVYLERVPPFATVERSVEIVKSQRGKGLSGLTNAVLRKVVAHRSEQPREPDSQSVPAWVRESLQGGLGAARTETMLRVSAQTPPLCLRVSPGADADALTEQLRGLGERVSVESSSLVEGSLHVRGAGDPRSWAAHGEGAFAVQDEGAQMLGQLLGARPGERVLDACAGHGGKTAQIACAVGPSGSVTAVDIHERKLELLIRELQRLGLGEVPLETCAVDLSVGDGGIESGFDRVLVDAPCTGLGTLRRRPEILLRLGPEDPARMARLQGAILDRAVSLLRPGGVLMYVVCSGSAQEGHEAARALERRHPGLTRLRTSPQGLPLEADDDGLFRIGPWLGDGRGTPDVYQAARWQLAAEPPV